MVRRKDKNVMIDRKTDFFTRMIGLVTIALFVIILFSKCIYLFDTLPVPIAVAVCIVILVLTILVLKFHHVIVSAFHTLLSKLESLSYSKMLIIIICISLVTKIVSTLVLQINSIDDHSDMDVYVTTSQDLAELGYAQRHADYCYSFSHMYWFAAFLTPVTALFGVSQFAYSSYMAIILTVIAVLLFDLVAYAADKGCAFLIVLLYLLLPSQILLSQYITHEIASLLFLSLFLWLYFKKYQQAKKKSQKCLFLIPAILSLFLCSALNSLGIIAIIAALIIFMIEAVRKRNKQAVISTIVKSTALILVFILGTILLGEFQTQHSELDPQKIPKNKVLWTLYVGSNYESKGLWFKDEKWDDHPENYDAGQIDEYHKELILDHYKDLLDPPTKLLDHLKNKCVTIWGNFVFPIAYSSTTISDGWMRQIYNRFLINPLLILNYSILLLIAVLGLAGLIKGRKTDKSPFFVFCELYLTGATALLLMTECRNKYSVSVIPIFIIVSLMIYHNSDRSKEKKLSG